RVEAHPAAVAPQLDADGLQRRDATALAPEADGADRVLPAAALLVGAGGLEGVPPLRPRVVRVARLGRPGHDLELVDAGAALAVDRAEAVGAGVAAADDDDVLALRRRRRVVGHRVA